MLSLLLEPVIAPGLFISISKFIGLDNISERLPAFLNASPTAYAASSTVTDSFCALSSNLASGFEIILYFVLLSFSSLKHIPLIEDFAPYL